MRRFALAVAVILGVMASGCALTTSNLNIAYDPAKAHPGPLSTVKPLSLEVKDLKDARPEKDKIGYKRNLYGQKLGHILAAKPVPEIVGEAIVTEFQKNGHVLNTVDPDLVISGEVTAFWFDAQVGFATVQFIGTVNASLTFTNRATNETLLTNSYQGYYDEESLGGLEGTWEHVMSTALERMVNQMSTDPKLIQALTVAKPN